MGPTGFSISDWDVSFLSLGRAASEHSFVSDWKIYSIAAQMHQKKKLKEPYMQLWEHFIISKFRSKSQLKYLIVSSSPLHYTVVKYVVHSVISAIPTGISYTSLTTTLLSKHQSNQYWCCVYVYVKLLLMFGQDALAILLLKLSWAIKPLLNWTELNWKRFTMPIHNEWISQLCISRACWSDSLIQYTGPWFK